MTIEQLLKKALDNNDQEKIKLFSLSSLVKKCKKSTKNCSASVEIYVEDEVVNCLLGGESKKIAFVITIDEEEFEKLKKQEE